MAPELGILTPEKAEKLLVENDIPEKTWSEIMGKHGFNSFGFHIWQVLIEIVTGGGTTRL